MPGLHAAIPAFGLALPEIVLAIGALALVLLGAIRGERSVNLVNGIALAILVLVGINRLKAGSPPTPAKAIEGVHEDIATVKAGFSA